LLIWDWEGYCAEAAPAPTRKISNDAKPDAKLDDKPHRGLAFRSGLLLIFAISFLRAAAGA
jgi:hypothetical protein